MTSHSACLVRGPLAIAYALLTVGLAIACDSGDEPAREATDAPITPTAAPSEDPELKRALAAVLSECSTIQLPHGQPQACTGDPLGDFTSRARALGTTHPMVALHTLAVALQSDDPTLVAVAANRLGNVVTPMLRDLDPAQHTAHGDTATLLFTGLKRLPPATQRQIAEATVLTGYLAGRQDELLGHLEAHPDAIVRAEAYRHLTTFGRTDVLPLLKQLAGSGDVGLATAALDAPRQLPNPTDAELGQLCVWVGSYLPHQALRVSEAAGKTMAWCGGPYINTLLAEGARRVKAKRLLLPFSRVYRDICDAPRAAAAQCERNLIFLRGVVDNPDIPVRVRVDALWNINTQRKTPETLALMRAWSKHDNKAIRERAARAVFLMTRAPNTPLPPTSQSPP